MTTKKATSNTTNTKGPEAGNGAKQTAFDPFAAFTNFQGFQGLPNLQPMLQDSFDRVQAFYDELAVVEREAYDRAKVASTQIGSLFAETIEYTTTLARELRQMTLEVARRGAQTIREQKAA